MDDNKIKTRNNCNEEPFVIPNEAACSPEFLEGCLIVEGEADES